MYNKGARLQPAERRAQILDVAASHFVEHRFEAASMAAIARDAGVTRALVYHYFPTKEDLLDGVLRAEGEELLAATAPVEGMSARENLERALRAYLAHFAKSDGRVRDLYAPTAMSPAVVWEIAAFNQEVQAERVLAILGLDPSHGTRLAVAGWVAFVQTVSRQAAVEHEVSVDTLLALFMRVLHAATGVDLDASTPLEKENER